MMPIAEEQSKLVANYLTGQLRAAAGRGDERRAHRDARADQGALSWRAPRHTIQINCGEYTYDLRRELAKGRKRAAAHGFVLPVEPRVVRPAAKQTVAA